MAWKLDARIPVRVLEPGTAVPQGVAVLAEEPAPPGAAGFALPATGHAIGCACCAPRSPAALALDALFLARVKGTVPWFDEVVALPRTAVGAAAIRAALSDDPVVTARFRAAP